MNNIVSAEYFPEDNEEDIGKISYDIEKKEVIGHEYCKKDSTSFLNTYFSKAISAIEKCVEKGEYPETVKYMWY